MTYKIQNEEIISNVREAGKLSLSEGFPSQLAEKILPVIEVGNRIHPKEHIVRSGALSAAGTSNTLYTTPTTGKFFLTGIQISMACSNTFDGTNIFISFKCTDGATRSFTVKNIASSGGIMTSQLPFTPPIELLQGSDIIFNCNGTAGTIGAQGFISGFTTY